MSDIFISYDRDDLDRVKPIIDTLVQHDWSIFWDRDIYYGQDFLDVIDDQLKKAKCVIVFWSKHAKNSPWVLKEALEAKQRKILVPITLDDDELPTFFGEIQTANFFEFYDGANLDFALKRLCISISLILNKQIYRSVKIGDQEWMDKNLNVNYYRNGDLIPQVKDPIEWESLTEGAWCFYENDHYHGRVYGRFYNWYAVNDPRGLAPIGWHVPSDKEWQSLEREIGMTWEESEKNDRRGEVGGKLKKNGTDYWREPNSDATNETNFTALAGGYRDDKGIFNYFGYCIPFWTSSAKNDFNAWARDLYYLNSGIYRGSVNMRYGLSVRCIHD